jgi:hypothetical protein
VEQLGSLLDEFLAYFHLLSCCLQNLKRTSLKYPIIHLPVCNGTDSSPLRRHAQPPQTAGPWPAGPAGYAR